MYIGNMRVPTRMNKLLHYNEEAIMIEYGYSKMDDITHTTINKTTWYEEI